VVVHPAYRGIGLGAELLREALLASDRPYVELVAVMARYNPFAERAGMIKVGVRSAYPKPEEWEEALNRAGLAELASCAGLLAARQKLKGKKRKGLDLASLLSGLKKTVSGLLRRRRRRK